MPAFTVTATAHLGPHPRRGLDVVVAALPGARFDAMRGDLVYRAAVDAIDPSEATKLVRERVLSAMRSAGVFAVASELEVWVTELEH